MAYNLDFTNNVSRFAFIFLIYAIITSGYIAEILSCQMRSFIQNYWYARHILAIILVFAFIMFEGGWDFNKERENKESNNWESGNTLHSLLIAVIIYFVFLISSKSRLSYNIVFFSLLFILYVTNTYREYWIRREDKNNKNININNNILFIEQIISIFAVIVLVFGFIEYYLYQKKEHPGDFNHFKFIVGTTNCDSAQKTSKTINMITKAINNIKKEDINDINKAIENMSSAIKNNQIALDFVKKISDIINNNKKLI
jgi:uncharacterized membrane protein